MPCHYLNQYWLIANWIHYGNQSRGYFNCGRPLWPPAVPRLAARPSQSNPRGSGPEVVKRERGHVTAETWSLCGGGLQGPPASCLRNKLQWNQNIFLSWKCMWKWSTKCQLFCSRVKLTRCVSSSLKKIDPSHKFHNVLGKYPTMHHFVTEMCTHAHFCY